MKSLPNKVASLTAQIRKQQDDAIERRLSLLVADTNVVQESIRIEHHMRTGSGVVAQDDICYLKTDGTAHREPFKITCDLPAFR